MLYIYLITQDKNFDFDAYCSAVVIADSEENAKKIHPNRELIYKEYPKKEETEFFWEQKDEEESKESGWYNEYGNRESDIFALSLWANPEHISAKLIGTVTSNEYEINSVLVSK
jgi:hypothetical protein